MFDKPKIKTVIVVSTDCYDDDDKMSMSKTSHTKEYPFCNQEL